jgi:hypothetical protein
MQQILDFLPFAVGVVLAFLAGGWARERRRRRQLGANFWEVVVLMDAVYDTVVALDLDEVIVDKAELPTMIRTLWAELESTRGSAARAERMNERYAIAVAEIWDLDSATHGGVDIDYLESLPHRLGLLTLTAAEMLALLDDTLQLVDDMVPTLPRGGRTPRLRARAAEGRDRRAGLPLSPGWGVPEGGLLTTLRICGATDIVMPEEVLEGAASESFPTADQRAALVEAVGQATDRALDDVSPTARIAAEIAEDWHAGTVATTGPLVEIPGSAPLDPHHVAAQIADRRGHHDGHPVH